MNKLETLTTAYTARLEEVEAYQINIENYTRAIEKITASEDEDLYPFREHLSRLLVTEILEQKKAKVILEVIKDQLNEIKE